MKISSAGSLAVGNTITEHALPACLGTDASTPPKTVMCRYERAITSWIENISTNEGDHEITDQWLKSPVVLRPHKSMIDAMASFTFVIDHFTFMGLSNIYVRIEAALEMGNTPWKYLQQHQNILTQTTDEATTNNNTTAHHEVCPFALTIAEWFKTIRHPDGFGNDEGNYCKLAFL